MSSVEIFAVRRNGDVVFYDEVRNAHGGALWMWQHLGDDYGQPFSLFAQDISPWWRWFADAARSGVLSDHDALIYKISCDWGIVPGELIATAADALEAFYRRHPHSTGDGIVVVLRRMVADPEVLGVCFNHTSVMSDPLWTYPPDYDEDSEEPAVYNVERHAGHWWIQYPARQRTNG